MIVYVDTSAALKRVVGEPESAALRRLLGQLEEAGHALTSSALTWVEATRALRRHDVTGVAVAVDTALSGVDELPLDVDVLRRARTVGPRVLRSLDAVHLASALEVGANSLLTYDERLAEAARDAGLDVLAPGA